MTAYYFEQFYGYDSPEGSTADAPPSVERERAERAALEAEMAKRQLMGGSDSARMPALRRGSSDNG